MEQILKINEIFSEYCSYNFINNKKYNKKNTRMRNMFNGIQLHDALYYKFLYSDIHTTKDKITSKINYINNTVFTRKAYESKENNIPNSVYYSIFDKLKKFYNNNCLNKQLYTELAVDGTNNNNNKQNVCLNMGYYDVNNDIPIDLTFNNTINRNKEVNQLIKHIKDSPSQFINTIIVADRLYFTYELLYFLDKHNIKFIIRVKGKGDNLIDTVPINKHIQHYNEILHLRSVVRVVSYSNQYKKQVKINGKKNKLKTNLLIDSTCTLVTNLSINEYDNDALLTTYKKRWSIETYFKLIKNNCKLQHMNEIKVKHYERLYKCELIITYILKIIEHYYIKEKINRIPDKSYTIKVNKTNMIKGIYEHLIYDILKGNLSLNQINNFCKTYIIFVKNKKDRHFPRMSNVPHSKWYVKDYSESSKFGKIIDAIINDTLNELHSNLKTIAKSILQINGIDVTKYKNK